MRTKPFLPVLALILGLGLTLALLAGLHTAQAAPTATNRFVKPDGGGSACTQAAPCALQTALGLAANGDTIYVAEGVYTGTGAAVITLTKSITLAGGWNGLTGGVVVDPTSYPPTLDGEWARRVVHISENITPTLDGLIVTRGNATGLTANCEGNSGNPDGCGGGIFAYNAHPTIINNVITNNVAAITSAGHPTGTTGYGGGLYLLNADRAVISGNLIISNAASTAYCGNGGGMHLYGTAAGTRVQANQVFSNYATTTNATGAWGGGISGGPDGALIQGNQVKGNWANGAGGGYGAGLYQWSGSAHYVDNLVQGNHGRTAVYLGYSRSLFEGNRVVDNTTTEGIRLQSVLGDGPVLVNNVVARSGSNAFSAYGESSDILPATLIHNTFVGAGSGYGVYAEYAALYLTNTLVASATWGITNTTPASATVLADHTLFYNTPNHSSSGVVSTDEITGNPRFVNPAGGDYHLGPGSAALDVGATTAITTDIDGDPRPIGPLPDIGADECVVTRVYLPLVVRGY